MSKTIQLICVLAIFSVPLLSQIPGQDSTRQAKAFYQKAEKALLSLQYKKAARYFERSVLADPNFCPSYRGLGTAYQLMDEYEKAIIQYEKILDINPFFSRVLYYQIAEAYHRIGNYQGALLFYKEFGSLQERPSKEFGPNGTAEREKEYKLRNKLLDNIHACIVSMDSAKYHHIKEVVNLGEAINSPGDEYFPFLTNDQKTLYFTYRKNTKQDENLFFSTWNEEEASWEYSEELEDFNTEHNEGMSTLVRDGRTMFFTACNREEIQGPCDIWWASLQDNEVLSKSQLSGGANSESWESQAAISCDGSMLFFASNRLGGIGGSDIWVSYRLGTGDWSTPVNLGPKINTRGDEEAPFITNDGKTLYFSSTGHLGLGEQDIFMSRQNDKGEWTTPINLGDPVNSSYRELGFFLSADGKTGYFASDRKGGAGGMDIYKFELPEQLYSDPITFVEGVVKDSILNVPIEATVQIEGRNAVPTDENGRFFLCVPANHFLRMQVMKKLFKPYYKNVGVPEWDNKTHFEIEILLKPTISFIAMAEKMVDSIRQAPKKPLELIAHTHVVYFGSDESSPNSEERKKLDGFLKKIKGSKIHRVDIIGYADNIGSDAYNLKLSEERAKKTKLILLDQNFQNVKVDYIQEKAVGEIKKTEVSLEESRKVIVKVFTVIK